MNKVRHFQKTAYEWLSKSELDDNGGSEYKIKIQFLVSEKPKTLPTTW